VIGLIFFHVVIVPLLVYTWLLSAKILKIAFGLPHTERFRDTEWIIHEMLKALLCALVVPMYLYPYVRYVQYAPTCNHPR
jgi:hypothetical protein